MKTIEVRCTRHEDSPYPVRCYECDELTQLERDSILDTRDPWARCRILAAKFDGAGLCLFCGLAAASHPGAEVSA